jgi:hypothetical protein
MIWSFSRDRTIKKCARQDFYRSAFANARAKDPERREAYLLSKLQSVSAWRGGVVDAVFSNFLVPALNRGDRPTLPSTLAYAKALFQKQLDFASHHRIRDPGMTPTKAADAFAAFLKLEYDECIPSEEFDRAWIDVETAIRNLYALDELRQLLRDGKYRVAQRSLTFSNLGATVRAVPDLIVFFPSRPPLIVDWKVHAFGVRGYADQLTTYAIALARVDPHKDFEKYVDGWAATDIELMEVQLLRRLIRKHPVKDANVVSAEERMAEGILTLQLAFDGKNPGELRPSDFPTAQKPDICQSCPFRKLCWRTEQRAWKATYFASRT